MSDCGIVRPRLLAVLRLMTSSYFVGCSTGMSPGFVRRRILSTYLPTFRTCRRRSPIGAVLRQLFQEHLSPARGQGTYPLKRFSGSPAPPLSCRSTVLPEATASTSRQGRRCLVAGHSGVTLGEPRV